MERRRGEEEKMRKVMGEFRNGMHNSLVLIEIKTIRSGEDEWCRVKCVNAEVGRNESERERVDILMSDWWYRSFVKFSCLSPRIIMVEF